MNLTSSARDGRAEHVAWSPFNQPGTILLLGGYPRDVEKTVEVISGLWPVLVFGFPLAIGNHGLVTSNEDQISL